MNFAVKTEDLYKQFSVQRTRTTAFRLLKRTLLGRHYTAGSFFALNNININILKGEKVGIIGDNGAGKTTLLKVLAGLHKPDKGQVYVKGSVTLLIGLGVGMIDELSLEENIYLYATIYGMDRNMITHHLHDIIEWAELQDFVGAKLKSLSSGMRTRLAFSAMRYINADIYLMDEALSAGDKSFKDKCLEFFRMQKTNHKTFLIATHDLDFVKMFCTRTLWLHKGKQVVMGETEKVLSNYINS